MPSVGCFPCNWCPYHTFNVKNNIENLAFFSGLLLLWSSENTSNCLVGGKNSCNRLFKQFLRLTIVNTFECLTYHYWCCWLPVAENQEPAKSRCGKLGKDPTVETSFLPDRSCIFLYIFHIVYVFGLNLELTSLRCFLVRERQRNKQKERGLKVNGSVSRKWSKVLMCL